MLDDTEIKVRHEAVHVIGQMGEAATPNAVPVAWMLEDDDSTVRANAAEALGKMGAALEDHMSVDSIMQSLAHCLEDTEPPVRRTAAIALQQCGFLADPYVTNIARLLEDEMAWVRLSAVLVLSQMGRMGVHALAGCITHDDVHIRRMAVEALGKVGSAAAPHAAALAGRLGDKDALVRKGLRRPSSIWVTLAFHA